MGGGVRKRCGGVERGRGVVGGAVRKRCSGGGVRGGVRKKY